MNPLFDKVKIVMYGTLVAALGAGIAYLNDVDFAQFGVFGPAIGLAIGAGLGWLKKETSGRVNEE